MLISTQAARYAHQLLDARARAQQIPTLSAQGQLSIADGYDIAKTIMDIRIAQGEIPIGRKIGFSNRKVWSKYGVKEPINTPIWTPMFDTTIHYAEDNRSLQRLGSALQPHIGAEIVFKLGETPGPNATMRELADCIEWMAHAFEILVCPFPDWKFELVDAIAAFGLHGSLIIGEPKSLSSSTRRNLGMLLADASLSLSCGDALCSAGFGTDVLGSPVHALRHLHRLLRTQRQFALLAAGEIVTTGTWTAVRPIAARQTWISAFSGLSLPGLTVSFE